MNISSSQKLELRSIIKEVGLQENVFDYASSYDILQIIPKKDFYTFFIRRLKQDLYSTSFALGDLNEPEKIGQSWSNTLVQFRAWANVIAENLHCIKSDLNAYNIDFPPAIINYSSGFPEIYKQAFTAEKIGLTEICGLGYRKAFEFLIRDYLLQKHIEPEHDKIKNMPASQCINQYVTSDEIKLLAHRVLWLGNDHAHYLKKWEDKSLADLKYLINLTIKWILIHDELIEVQSSMPSGRQVS